MEITISRGRKATVGISHIKEKGARGTKVWVRLGTKSDEQVVMCHSSDNFCKRTGRKLAASRLLARLRKGESTLKSITKNDRGVIFGAICPELTK